MHRWTGALTCEPQSVSHRRRHSRPNCSRICKFERNAPIAQTTSFDLSASEKKDGLGAWLVKQLDDMPEFKVAWMTLIQKVTKNLNAAVDRHLVQNNMHLSQFIQDHTCGVDEGLVLNPMTEYRMKAASLEAIFGTENLTLSDGSVDTPPWMVTGGNNIVNILKNRWRKDYGRAKGNLLKSKAATEAVMKGKFISGPSTLDVSDIYSMCRIRSSCCQRHLVIEGCCPSSQHQ